MSIEGMMAAELDAVRYPFGKRPPYTCPSCDSDNIAHELTKTTTRYYGNGPVYVYETSETVVRCVDCGTADRDYKESLIAPR